MDILLISRCPPFPLFHGDRLIPYHLAQVLSARRHLIDLLAFYQEPEDLAEVPRYEHLFRHIELIEEPVRSPASLLRRHTRPATRFPRRAEQSWSPAMWQAIEEAIETRSYDVVHLFGGIHVYEFRNLVRSLPNVIVPYESYSLWLDRAVAESRNPLRRMTKRLQRRMARSFESWMFDGFDRTVVLTDHDARALRELNPHIPTVTIPNGVDVDFFNPTGYEPDEPAVMFIGNYDYLPNLDAALRLVRDIFPRVRQEIPAARLYLVGGNPPRQLRRYASDHVEITGRVPDIRPYFEYSTIFASPLRLGAGIKNKILEALAMGVPVVATPLSCDGIPVVHGEHVWIGHSDSGLAQGILRLLQDPALRLKLRRNGRQLIEDHFTWQRVGVQYESLYQHIIREHHERAAVGLA